MRLAAFLDAIEFEVSETELAVYGDWELVTVDSDRKALNANRKVRQILALFRSRSQQARPLYAGIREA